MVKVAVIGPEEIVKRVAEEGNKISELDLFPAPYQSEIDSLNNSLQIDPLVDIILYTGPVPYMIAKKHSTQLKSTLMYISYSGTGLYRVLFQMVNDGVIKRGNENKISLDFLNKDEAIGTFEELDIDSNQIQFLELMEGQSSSEIAEHHLKLWQTGAVDAVITCLFSVYNKLKEQGVLVYCIIPTRSAITNSLRMALASGRFKSSENNQIAVCQFSLEAEQDQDKCLKFISDSLQTSLQKTEDQTYLVFTTKGLVMALTEGLKNKPSFLSDSYRLRMGIGLGITAKEAVLRSHNAYQKSNNEGHNIVYMIGDENSVVRINLHGAEEQIEYQSRSYDELIRNVAQETKLSFATLSKIKYVSNALGKYDVTAPELAKQLNLTLRSARRILKALADEGYAEVVGGEQPILRGRPRQIYKLLF